MTSVPSLWVCEMVLWLTLPTLSWFILTPSRGCTWHHSRCWILCLPHKSVWVTVVVEDGLKEKLLKYHGHELGGVILIGEKGEADLKLIQINDEVGFKILEKECVDLGMTRTHYRPGSSMPLVTHLLQHASHFYLHLRRSNQEIKFGLASKYHANFYRSRDEGIYTAW